MKMKIYFSLLLSASSMMGYAQQHAFFDYKIEASALAGKGKFAPLWFSANRFGVYGNDKKQALLRAGVNYRQELKHNWRVGAGLELVGGKNLVSDFWVHQAYVDIAWRKLNLSIGSKERFGFPLEKNSSLSSGWLVEGNNARPVPQMRLETVGFWSVPGMNDWLAMKGHIAFGEFVDGRWQKDFVSSGNRYVNRTLYQSKSLMFRLGNQRVFPLDFEFGILMAGQFGGRQYIKNEDGTVSMTIDMPKGLKSYWKAFFPQSGDSENPIKGEQANIEGNVLGSWNFALNSQLGDWKLRMTYEHYFEDHSQMFWQYGRWKDGQLGLEIGLPKNRWVSNVVWEVMSTKDMSGPFEFYDSATGECLFSGGDSYFNHYIYQAWQNYGMGMGYPLIPGPIYNADGSITFKSNRVSSHHIGIDGNPSDEWSWRVLASFVRHWGTYGVPLDKQRKQFSGMAEVKYLPNWAKGWSVSATAGLDRGNYLGNQTGVMVSLCKTGGFNF